MLHGWLGYNTRIKQAMPSNPFPYLLFAVPRPVDDETSRALNERQRIEAKNNLLHESSCMNCHWWRGRIVDGACLDGACKAFPWVKGERVTVYNDSCPHFTTKAQWVAKLKEGAQ